MQSYEKNTNEYKLWIQDLKQTILWARVYDTPEALANLGRAFCTYLSESRLWDRDTVEPSAFTQFFTLLETLQKLSDLIGGDPDGHTKGDYQKKQKVWFDELFSLPNK